MQLMCIAVTITTRTDAMNLHIFSCRGWLQCEATNEREWRCLKSTLDSSDTLFVSSTVQAVHHQTRSS